MFLASYKTLVKVKRLVHIVLLRYSTPLRKVERKFIIKLYLTMSTSPKVRPCASRV